MRQPTAEHLAWFPVRYSLDQGKYVIIYLPHGPVICGTDPYQAAKDLASYWTPGPVINLFVKCLMLLFLLVFFVGPIIQIAYWDRKGLVRSRKCPACSPPGEHGHCHTCKVSK